MFHLIDARSLAARLALVALAGSSLVGLAASPASAASCKDGNIVYAKGSNDIKGTECDDVIYGSPNDDVIHGMGGDDEIHAGSGDDVLYGGSGTDTMLAGDGNDILRGGSSFDHLFGEKGNDNLNGELAGDNLLGGDGDDLLFDYYYSNSTNAGNDMLDGGKGNDYLNGGTGSDYHYGQAGNDRFEHNENKHTYDKFDGGTGNDTFNVWDMATNTNATYGTRDEVVCGTGSDKVMSIDKVADTTSACEEIHSY